MQSSLTVRKIADANYIPVKYSVVEMTVGSTPAATYCALQTIRVGWDNVDNWRNWDISRNTTGMQGTLGALEVVALDTIALYDTQTPTAGTYYEHRSDHI